MNDLNKFGVIECTNDIKTACIQIAIENIENFRLINENLFADEFVCEMSKVDFKDHIKLLINSINEAIQKFWSKIMGVFKKVNQFIWKNTNNYSLFLKKYKPLINTIDNLNLNIYHEHHKFNNIWTFTEKLDKVMKETSEMIPNIYDLDQNKINELNEKYVQSILSIKKIFVSGFYENENKNFTESLKNEIIGEKGKSRLGSFISITSDLSDSKRIKDNLLKSYKLCEIWVKNLLKDTENFSKFRYVELKDDPSPNERKYVQTAVRLFANYINEVLVILSQALQAYMSGFTLYFKELNDAAKTYLFVIKSDIKNGKIDKNFWKNSKKDKNSNSVEYDEVIDDEFFDDFDDLFDDAF